MNTPNLRSIIERFGLVVSALSRRRAGRFELLDVKGNYPDGKPFSKSSEPFIGDDAAVTVAEVLAKTLISERSLSDDISAHTNRIAVARVVAKGLIEGRRMALADKCKLAAERAHAVPKALEARADAVLDRLAALEPKGNSAFDGLEAHITDAESAVAETESAVRAISNAPFGNSEGSQGS